MLDGVTKITTLEEQDLGHGLLGEIALVSFHNRNARYMVTIDLHFEGDPRININVSLELFDSLEEAKQELLSTGHELAELVRTSLRENDPVILRTRNRCVIREGNSIRSTVWSNFGPLPEKED